MTASNAGGQLEKERPPSHGRVADAPKKAEVPPRPRPPYKLAGSHLKQCGWTFSDKTECAYEKHGESSFCCLHEWISVHGDNE